MTDDLDDELLALAGDSEEEHSPAPEVRGEDSPAHSPSSHSPERSQMGRKGTAKAIRRPRKAAREEEDEEDGEV